MRDEIGEQLLELCRRDGDAFRLDSARDHHPRAAADQIARGLIGHRRQSFPREHHVEGVDEIGRGIDQGAVEVENDGWGGHGRIASAGYRKVKGLPGEGYPGGAIGAR